LFRRPNRAASRPGSRHRQPGTRQARSRRSGSAASAGSASRIRDALQVSRRWVTFSATGQAGHFLRRAVVSVPRMPSRAPRGQGLACPQRPRSPCRVLGQV
jgi:hypothetical protein